MNASVTPPRSTSSELGPLSSEACGAARSSPGSWRSSGRRTSGSLRSTIGGVAPDASITGCDDSISRSHCAEASAPPNFCSVATHAVASPVRKKKSPSGSTMPQPSYSTHSTDDASPTASSTCRSGLTDGRESPAHSDGPLSNVYPPRSKECAQPPAMVWDSSTVTRRPYRAKSAPQQRPPMPEPMTTTSGSEDAAELRGGAARGSTREAAAAAIATIRSAAQQVPWALSRWYGDRCGDSISDAV